MAEYHLYCFAQSGNAYKAALMLELTGCDWGSRFVDFFNGETRTPEYRRLNIMGEVPVLVHGDVTLSQSGVILDYLAERTGKFGWHNDAERRDVLRWLLFDNHKLTSYTATYRFLRTFVKEPDPAVLEFFRGRMSNAFSVLAAHLAENNWLLGRRATIADLSLCGYLFFEDEIGVNFAEAYPTIDQWLGRIRELPGWRHPYDLMPGHPLPGA
ncbi:glutathione S-transferase [Tepidamorphus gemmatus]|uniref:Glutathione S-transferase n=1 Tax=Tepidamorphus gemmatus TaxID=747076 RepID=A0A4R3MH49_9HYPH|nr:glutathione S-transferase [Tepidamorphus gemmatus]TCT13151.1 glutathione S-transferase [Tepidamorphus gemmatus]